MPAAAPLRVSAERVFRYRARATHLDTKLSGEDALAAAAWGGQQDTIPRAGLMALHARVDGTDPDSWEDPSLVQIWFRAGADYIVPRADVGVFTLGCYPRDPGLAALLERTADAVHRATGGAVTRVRELPAELVQQRNAALRQTSATGRVLIRWNASDIWVVPVERPAMDVDEARLELARRFLHWFGPATVRELGRWTGEKPRDARLTWDGLACELLEVTVEEDSPEPRWMLDRDVPSLMAAEPIQGVRLLPPSDPFLRLNRELLVPDPDRRRRVLPEIGQSPGYAPGAILVDGRVAGVWQRQAGRVRLAPFDPLSKAVAEAVEEQARSMPIRGGITSVRWD
jgi:hypothetical protein